MGDDHRHWHTTQYQKWIQSTRWLRLRNWYICEHPFCEMCQESGIATSAQCVHHITPVESVTGDFAREQLMFAPGNLMSLCHQCHIQVHTELRSNTPELRAKRIEDNAIAIADAMFADGETCTPPTPQHKQLTKAFEMTKKSELIAKRKRRGRKRGK